jgi:hypothetical protein
MEAEDVGRFGFELGIVAIPRAFQLATAALSGTTDLKSMAYPMGRWRFTESLQDYH